MHDPPAQALTAQIVYPVPANVTFSRFAAETGASAGGAPGTVTRRLLARNATAEPQLVRLRGPRSPAFSVALGDGSELGLDAAGLSRAFELPAGGTLAFAVSLRVARLPLPASLDDSVELHTRKYAHTVPLLARAQREVEAGALVGRVDTDVALLGGGWALHGAEVPAAAPRPRVSSLGAQLRASGGGRQLGGFAAELTPVEGVSDPDELAFYSQLVSADVRARASVGRRAGERARGAERGAELTFGAREEAEEEEEEEEEEEYGAGGSAAQQAQARPLVELLPPHALGAGAAPRISDSDGGGPEEATEWGEPCRAEQRGVGAADMPDGEEDGWTSGSLGADPRGAGSAAQPRPPLGVAPLTAVAVSERAELDFYTALLRAPAQPHQQLQPLPQPQQSRGASLLAHAPVGALGGGGLARAGSRPPSAGHPASLPPLAADRLNGAAPAGARARAASAGRPAPPAEGAAADGASGPLFLVNGSLFDARGRAVPGAGQAVPPQAGQAGLTAARPLAPLKGAPAARTLGPRRTQSLQTLPTAASHSSKAPWARAAAAPELQPLRTRAGAPQALGAGRPMAPPLSKSEMDANWDAIGC